ncbi:MAG TPA: M23 family metallopeptidase [Patescibacteria group bacterium]|nr:M23 family metallopeptidase [Patescibacteria group bacterium]
MQRSFQNFFTDITNWRDGWFHYIERHLRRFAIRFETQKGVVVDILMARRGTYQRPFLHLSLGILLVVGVIGAPVVANAYPGGLPSQLNDYTPSSAILTSIDLTEYGVQTQISQKPRDQVISYTVKDGDTLAKVATTFGVSVDTIRWANDLKSDNLSIGDTLKIPPVTGIVHTVEEGETVQSIAKKYKTDPQKIVNFPFNDFADLDTFTLNVGQTLIVPDGVQPEAPALAMPEPIFTSQPLGTGQLLWPTNGIITQCPIWYHMAFDIANNAEPAIMAADDGVVVYTGYQRFGYGNHVIISHGGNFSTLYGHMTEYYVKVGDRVAKGQVIGKMGSTGRSTGPHLHFETRINNTPVNPGEYFHTSCGG